MYHFLAERVIIKKINCEWFIYMFLSNLLQTKILVVLVTHWERN